MSLLLLLLLPCSLLFLLFFFSPDILGSSSFFFLIFLGEVRYRAEMAAAFVILTLVPTAGLVAVFPAMVRSWEEQGMLCYFVL